MKKSIKEIFKSSLILVVILTLFGCGGGSSSSGLLDTVKQDGLNGASGYVPSTTKPSDAELSSNYNISLSNLSGHSVYAVASNQLINHERSSRVKFYGGTEANVVGKSTLSNDQNKSIDEKIIVPFIPKFEPFSEKEVLDKTSSTINESAVSASVTVNITEENFTVYKYGDIKTTIKATVRKRRVISGKGLNIWVDNDIWTGSEEQIKLINKIADKFLLDGNDDIYGYVTGIFGDEYYQLTHAYQDRIQGGDINIILFNINGSTPGNSRTLGYFDAKDVFKTYYVSDSNEKLALYMDYYSLMDSDEFWSDSAESTIAHEFFHMVMFYQKYLLSGEYPESWLNEMLAMVTEDIISYKLGLRGPRGVDNLSGSGTDISNGRLPQANNEYLNRVSFSSSLSATNYSTVYAFGAYLLRNFGSDLTVFRNIVQSNLDGFAAIESAIANTYKSYDLVLNNAKAMILSQKVFIGSEKYKYNGGVNGFRLSIGNNAYDVGSINLYNYSSQPSMYVTGSTPVAMNMASSLLFKLADNKTGSFNVNLSLPYYTKVEIIVLDSNGNYDISKSAQIQVNKI